MGQFLFEDIQALVTEEIRRTIADAIDAGTTVSSAVVAACLSRTYPNCGLTGDQIADQVMMAAAKAGVAVEIGRPHQRAAALPA